MDYNHIEPKQEDKTMKQTIDYTALADTIRAELKRKHGGTYEPNSRETWLDVQARALYQACNRIRTICRTNGLYCKGVQ